MFVIQLTLRHIPKVNIP